ncbi:T-complex protein 1 [Coprinellus micaceus]|uniref:T-complex protein 1 n=1 Tax=Coprinellus micaceus TaxID=71717 RepID=A0A4Y7TVN6_COPMI|nr:T-complex protein 1 [Coprinellus micaceus]
MALKVPKSNNLQLFKDGYKHLQGLDDAVLRNIQAVNELSNTVRTSFGPNGASHTLSLNHLGRLFVTSDAATIIRELEVAQEAEMGDATNMVLIFAGELLKRAEHLLIMGLHPSEALEELEKLSTFSLPAQLTPSSLALALKPAIASKQYGSEDFLADLVAEAALTVMPNNPKSFNVDNVRVVKIMGGSLSSSKVVQGMVFGREPEGTVKKTKGTVLIKSADQMLNFSSGEEKHMEAIFKEIADSGVKLALHFLNRLGIAVLKVLSKFDLRRLCRVVSATPLARVGAPTPEEAGFVDVFETVEIGGDRVTVVRQLAPGDEGYDASSPGEKTKTATIVLRGATSNHLDDLERAIDDGVNVIKSLMKDPRLVPGAGATELELAKRVDAYGRGLKGLSQHSNALGGAEGNEVLSRLWAKHDAKGGEAWGVDVEAEADGTLDANAHKIYDSIAAKKWAIKLATEAAVSVLSVDSIIMSKPAGGPKIPQQSGNWDEDD